MLFQNRLDEAHEAIVEGLELIRRVGNFRAEAISRLNYSALLCEFGEPAAGMEQAEIARATIDRIGAKVWEPLAWSSLGLCQSYVCDRTAAIASARKGANMAVKTSRALLGPWSLGILALVTTDADERRALTAHGLNPADEKNQNVSISIFSCSFNFQ